MRIFLGALILLCVHHVAVAGVIRPGSLQARSNGTHVVLNWITDDETNVVKFEIERRAGTSGSFVTIATVDPKGPSLYEFVDPSAYKSNSTIYQYRIKVLFSGGAPAIYEGPVTVNHTVSGVRRTWGSIKAMFR